MENFSSCDMEVVFNVMSCVVILGGFFFLFVVDVVDVALFLWLSSAVTLACFLRIAFCVVIIG